MHDKSKSRSLDLTYSTTLPSGLACGPSLFAAFALAFILTLPLAPLSAQGLKSDQSLQKIIDSDVEEGETTARDNASRIIAAIDKTVEAASAVRKTTFLDEIEIVFLTDVIDDGLPSALETQIERHESEIAQLRLEMEGNAMLYHAIDSHGVMLKDVIAIEFHDERRAVIFVAAKPTG
ncbi:hypothetical protein [Mesorhizobium sp. A556]